MPAESAVATTTALTLVLFLSGGTARMWAQAGMAAPAGVDTQTSYYARTPFEKEMQREIVCTCNCGHQPIGECRKDPCGVAHQMRGELAAMIDEGKSRDEIVSSFVARYGSEEMLAKPLNRGFNRLAWWLPIAVGGTAAFGVALIAVRWSRRHDKSSPESPAAIDPQLDERLDDELRNLD
jgi:cytochrome c-type biogenesis protein CcmH/NrfF